MALREPQYTVRLLHPVTFAVMGILDDYESLRYTRRWQGLGDLVLRVHDRSRLIRRILQTNTGIEVLRDGVQEFVGWVDGWDIAGDEQDESSLVWVVGALSAPGDVASRLTLPAPLTTNDASTTVGGDVDKVTGVAVSAALRHYVNVNCISAYELARNVPYLHLGNVLRPSRFVSQTDLPLPKEEVSTASETTRDEWNHPMTTQIVTWTARFEDLMRDVQPRIAKAGNAGFTFRVEPDEGRVYFDVVLPAYRHLDAGAGWREAVFSVGRNALGRFAYGRNGREVVNAAYAVAGGTVELRKLKVSVFQGPGFGDETHDPVRREETINADPMGDPYVLGASAQRWGRREGLFDTRQTTDPNVAADLVNGFLQERGEQVYFSFSPLETPTLRYMVDWDLGDKVTAVCDVLRAFPNLRVDGFITEVTGEIKPGGAPQFSVTVGSRRTDMLDSIVRIDRGARPAVAV